MPPAPAPHLIAAALDITGRKDMEERLRHEATTDPLTGAVNRRKLELHLREETGRFTRTGQIFSLVMMDLDHFKQINDTYGHAVGDMVLCHFTDICMGCLRKADHLSRVGGEEFAVLLPDTGEADAFDIASRIRRAVKDAPYSHNGSPVPYTISAGCAELKDQYSEPTTLMNIADAALYRAKKSGRDRVVAASADNCGISGL